MKLFWEKRDVYTGHLVVRGAEYRSESGHRLIVSASSCQSPCQCQGFEVCAHLLYKGSRSPIHPVFSASSEEEARQTAAQLRRYLRTELPPLPDTWSAEAEDDLQQVVRAFGIAAGFDSTPKVVWRKLSGFSGFIIRLQEIL